MNTNQLKYFVAAAEHRSFTKAANQYYLSQTAITQQIRALEESIGIQLFDRNTRPIALTPAGSIFLIEAKAILERIQTAVSRTKDASVGLVGTLSIGYIKGYERSNLSNKLRDFHQNFPSILMTCHRYATDTLAAGLMNGEYDIIFTWDSTNLAQDPHVEYLLIEQAKLMAALYPSHPFSRRKHLYRKELHGETILYMSPSESWDSVGDTHFMQLYQQAGYQPSVLFRSSDVESILMMVAAEEGISILPDYCTNKLINADNLVFIPLVGDEEVEEIVAMWKKDNENKALQRFLELLREED